MKRYIIILVALLIVPVICFAQKKQNKKRTNNKIGLPTKVAPVFCDAIKCYNETIMVDNAPLVFKEYTSKTQDESVNDSFIFVNVEWPVKWRGYDFAPLQKALLSWMQNLNENTKRFNSVEDVLNAYSEKSDFGCKYFSSDICIYQYNSVYKESSFFYYDLKNKKALNLYDLIISKSEAVQAIVNYFNIIKSTNSDYSKDSFKNDIDTLREKGVDDILIEKDHITFFSESSSYAVPIKVAMPALTNRAKEIIKNMPTKKARSESVTSTRPVKGVLKLLKAREDLSYYTDRDISSDADVLNGSVIDYSPTKFRFLGEQCGDTWDYFIPKSKVKIEEYGFNDLLLSDIGNRITFISDDGVHKVQIIKYNKNGHNFVGEDFETGKPIVQDPLAQSKRKGSEANKANYILCYEIKDNRVEFIPLEVDGDHVCLYNFSKDNDVYFSNDYLKYNIMKYNIMPECFPVDYIAFGYYTISSFFDDNGNMISDIPETKYKTEFVSVVYLHDPQQLYISNSYDAPENGFLKLFALKEDNSGDSTKVVFKVTETESEKIEKKLAGRNLGELVREREERRKARQAQAENPTPPRSNERNGGDGDDIPRGGKTQIPAAEEAKNPINHKVSDGENLDKIAKRYGVSVQEIKSHNNITDDNKLRSGSTLKIPKKAKENRDHQ